MKNRKTIMVLVVICLLLVGALVWKGLGSKSSSQQDPQNPQDPGVIDGVAILNSDDTETDSDPATQPGEETGQQDDTSETGQSDPAIIEDGGDLIVIVPEDQESGGV